MSEYRFNAIGYVKRGGSNPSNGVLQASLIAQLAAQGLSVNYVVITETNTSILYFSFVIGGSVSGSISQSNFYSRVRIALNKTFNQSFDNFNGAIFTGATTTKPTTKAVTTKDVTNIINQNQQTTNQNLPVIDTKDTEESFTDMLKKYGISTSALILAGVAILIASTRK